MVLHSHKGPRFSGNGNPGVSRPVPAASTATSLRYHATDLHSILQHRGIKQLVVTGVTTEVCVNTTVREANDRGYDCLVLEDCVDPTSRSSTPWA